MNLVRALFRKQLEDFIVEEIPAYATSGEGEHLFITVRKRDVTTLDAVSRISEALRTEARGAGFAGMKDRRAVATQTISVPFPLARAPDEALVLSLPGIEVLGAARHRNKLKPGHLVGNRFEITLRDIEETRVHEIETALAAAMEEGVPNAFGPQRFGRDGDNPERALAWLSGKERGPRGRREQRLLFSALQSHLFNQVLAVRETEGTWAVPLRGDLVKKRDTGGLFPCEDPEIDGERARARQVSPTGPIFGLKMRRPTGKPDEIERKILLDAAGAAEVFDRHGHLGEGTRRALRLLPEDLKTERFREQPGVLRVQFVLPKGSYATTVLARAVTLVSNAPESNDPQTGSAPPIGPETDTQEETPDLG